MRKVKDNQQLRKLISSFYVDPFKRRDSDKFVLPIDRLAALKLKRRTKDLATLAHRRDYVTHIENNFQRIQNATVTEMRRLIRDFNAIIPVNRISKRFSDEVKKAMGYEDMREKEFPFFFSQLSIKTCMYCHSQLTLTITKEFYTNNTKVVKQGEVKTRKALLELDHKYPASKYPFLATSLYNLLPVCGNCNGTKHVKTLDIDFFTAGEKLDIFKFSIEPQSLIDFEMNRDREVLLVNLNHVDGDVDFEKKYNEMFDVKEIYNMQQDILEELLIKRDVYNKPYVSALVKRFQRLFPDQGMVNRLIVGNYAEADEVHKRPMAKFMQDIARDIGLIPK